MMSDLQPSDAKEKRDVASAETKLHNISVVITKMPEPPSKPLLKDSNRLLALAAFLLSLITGTYAAYSTWRTQRESTVETVGRLVEQYYKGTERLKAIDPNKDQAAFIFIQTEQKGTATRAYLEAKRVTSYIDVGLWSAVAQINVYAGNPDEAKKVFQHMLDVSNDVYNYVSSKVGIATADAQLKDLKASDKLLTEAMKEVSEDVIRKEQPWWAVWQNHTITNTLTPIQIIL